VSAPASASASAAGGVLAGETDALAQLGRVAHDIEAGDAGRSRVGEEQRREDAHHRRLARAVGTEQPEHRPALDVEVDAVERLNVTVGLGQPAYADREIVVGRPRAR